MASDLFTDPAFNSHGIKLGQLYHVGMVVHNVAEAVERYGELFGITNWKGRPPQPGQGVAPPPVAHGGSGRGVLKWAYTNYEQFPWLEFLQPDAGVDTVLSRFLAERGEGIHHLGYFVDDLALAIKAAEEKGITADYTSLRGGENGEPTRGIAYLSPKKAYGMCIELVSPDLRQTLVNFVKTGVWPDTL